MQKRPFTPRRSNRRGFTLIELLVVISIIATLMALILPAIQSARESARRTECLNHQRNIALALINQATAQKGQMTPYGYFIQDTSGTLLNGRSWVVDLLPYMDRQDIRDRWNTGVDFTTGVNAGLGATVLDVFACPNDDSAFKQAGGLSYVLNAGFGDVDARTSAAPLAHSPLTEPFNWDGDAVTSDVATDVASLNDLATPLHDTEDEAITKAMGVFWPEYQGVSRSRNNSINIGKIYDGAGMTVMLSENVNAGVISWANPAARSCAFWLPINDATLVDATFFENGAGSNPSNNVAAGGFPNSSKPGPDGERPAPNSLHPGTFVVAFCDGTVQPISETIDRSVYVRMLTPDGSRLRSGFSTESPLSEDAF